MASRLFARTLTPRSLARPSPVQQLIIPKRFNSTEALPKDPILLKHYHAKQHAAKSAELWRKLSYYVCLPATFVTAVYVYQIESAHIQHRDHVIAENGGELPEEGKPKYEYQNIRKKAFPWGPQSLFFNPKANYPAEEM